MIEEEQPDWACDMHEKKVCISHEMAKERASPFMRQVNCDLPSA